MAGCLAQLEQWGVRRQYAAGELPVLGVYGLPEQWPHIRAIYERAGFAHEGHTEIVYITKVDEVPRPRRGSREGTVPTPFAGHQRHASVRGSARRRRRLHRGGHLEGAERLPRHGGWADVGNLEVFEEYRRRGIATWLVGHAADWLRLPRVDRVLDYARPEDEDYTAFVGTVGFRELTRTQRGWVRTTER